MSSEQIELTDVDDVVARLGQGRDGVMREALVEQQASRRPTRTGPIVDRGARKDAAAALERTENRLERTEARVEEVEQDRDEARAQVRELERQLDELTAEDSPRED